jgi:peptidyl-tRNA hydrolase, PTH1 family
VKLIVGLGNPGEDYSDTRHNAGKAVLEFLARERGLRWSKKNKLKASLASFNIQNEEVVLACPETYMNLSGDAVILLTRHYQIDAAKDLLILVDDVALPFGKFRLRKSGSDGGHNGLKSIETALGTKEYPRLRIGIGSISSAVMKEYVLDRFTKEEKKQLPNLLSRGRKACELWISQPLSQALNVVNASEFST